MFGVETVLADAAPVEMVPLVRLELTLLAETDFESVASTNSATGAPWKRASAARKLVSGTAKVNAYNCAQTEF